MSVHRSVQKWPIGRVGGRACWSDPSLGVGSHDWELEHCSAPRGRVTGDGLPDSSRVLLAAQKHARLVAKSEGRSDTPKWQDWTSTSPSWDVPKGKGKGGGKSKGKKGEKGKPWIWREETDWRKDKDKKEKEKDDKKKTDGAKS